MPPKRSTRYRGNRYVAIAVIVVCIVGTAILIAARTSDLASAEAAGIAPGALVPPARLAASASEPAAEPSASSTAPAKAPVRAAAAPKRVTIDGCLVKDGDRFRLKNTSGEKAPKGRSWKSGFLVKGSKTVDVVDARRRLNLARHVGERVSVTGVLDEDALQGAGLKRLAKSCS